MSPFEFIDRNNEKAKRSTNTGTNYLFKECQKQISSEPETFEF